MTAKPRSQRTWYRILHQVHLWAGIILCVPFVLLGVTGSILVFEHELDALSGGGTGRPSPGAATTATAPAPPQPLAAVIAAVRAEAPPELSISMIQIPEEPGEPLGVRLSRGGQRGPGGRQALVDPVSLEVAWSEARAPGLLRDIFMLHANLLVRDRAGRATVGWLGVVMVGLGVTGLVMWWPRPGRWRAAFTVPRGARGVRLHRDLHGAVGIWSLAVFLVVSASGVYLAFPQSVGAGVSALLPARDLRAAAASIRVQPVPGVEAADADEAVAIATAAVPGATLRSVGLPARPEAPYRIGFVVPGYGPGAPGLTVHVDPWSRRAVEVFDPRTYSTGETILAWQHALHAGAGLGPLWKGAVFLSGALPPLFVVTGIAMWLLKRRARRAIDAQRARALAGGQRAGAD